MPENLIQRDFAAEIVAQLRAAGHEALFAGGCVRDQLLGVDPKDYDVATSALPNEVRALFGQRRTLAIGAAFGVITVLGGKRCEPVEVATFRSDGEYLDGRRPVDVHYTTAEYDAQRRDFTVNGIFYDPLEDKIVDYVDGRRDLEQCVIRAIGDPAARFAEDKLRMLRAVRFATTYDFEIEPATLAAIREMADDVTAVSAERIGAELERTLRHVNRRRGVELLAATGLLKPLLPELFALPADAQEATLVRLERLGPASLAAVMAALVVEAISLDVIPATEAAAICRRFRFTNKTAERMSWLLANLSRIELAQASPWPKLQRVLVHEGAAELLQLAEALWSAEHAGLLRSRERLALPAEQLNPAPLVGGDELIAHGLAPGKHFAALLDHLRDMQLDGLLTTHGEALAEAERWIEAHGPR